MSQPLSNAYQYCVDACWGLNGLPAIQFLNVMDDLEKKEVLTVDHFGAGGIFNVTSLSFLVSFDNFDNTTPDKTFRHITISVSKRNNEDVFRVNSIVSLGFNIEYSEFLDTVILNADTSETEIYDFFINALTKCNILYNKKEPVP